MVRRIWVTIKYLGGSYGIWIFLQVYVGGKQVLDEITIRGSEVLSQGHYFATKQWGAAVAGYEFGQSLLKLLAPFFFDMFFLVKAGWSRLPREVQIGSLGAAGLTWLLYSFRWARQAAFLPSAAGMWYKFFFYGSCICICLCFIRILCWTWNNNFYC